MLTIFLAKVTIALFNKPERFGDLMKRCPYCFEVLTRKMTICPHCDQFIIDEIVEVEYQAADKKRCLFCGKAILTEATVCRWCHRWVDEAGQANDDGKAEGE